MREDSDTFEGQLKIVKETPRENDINNANVGNGLATQRFTPKKMLKVFQERVVSVMDFERDPRNVFSAQDVPVVQWAGTVADFTQRLENQSRALPSALSGAYSFS